MEKTQYFNFPIQLLQGAFSDISKTMSDVMDYAGYAHTLKLEHGTDEKKMDAAGKHFGITFGDSRNGFRSGERFYKSFGANSPMTGINKDTCFDFYKNYKTQNEIAVLLSFLALKSIIGNKAYIKTSNEYLITRMGGYVSKSDLPNPIPEPLRKFNTRRKIERLKFELETNWEMNFYARNVRGFYVSNGNTSLDKLILEAERNRKKYLNNKLKTKKEEALAKAYKQLELF